MQQMPDEHGHGSVSEHWLMSSTHVPPGEVHASSFG
jgi:hypothetical protein